MDQFDYDQTIGAIAIAYDSAIRARHAEPEAFRAIDRALFNGSRIDWYALARIVEIEYDGSATPDTDHVREDLYAWFA